MAFDPNFTASIKIFELLDDVDRVALARVIDELNVPSGHALRGPH